MGYNAFKVLNDRLDRVFSLGRFMIQPDMDPALGPTYLPKGSLVVNLWVCRSSCRGWSYATISMGHRGGAAMAGESCFSPLAVLK